MRELYSMTILALLVAFAITPEAVLAQSFKLGLVSDGDPGENAAAAYDWAKRNYDAVLINVPTSKDDLIDYGVVWWDEGNGAAIPEVFLENNVIDAFVGYVEDGGALLLSNLAFHYLFETGIDSGEPRYFGNNLNAVLDWTDFQIAEGEEDHPVFKGMDIEDGIIQYDILGYTDGSDFYSAGGPTGPNEGEVLAQVVDGQPQTNPLVEYKVGDGVVIAIGWVWASWVVNEELEDVHGKLHENMIDYLASLSRFAAVDASGKLSSCWAEVKAGSR